MQDPETLASGLARGEIEGLLHEAEPRRLQALSASLNLAAGMFLTLLGSNPAGLVWPLVAAVVAITVWQVSQRLWRNMAIAAVAPALGQPWGQSRFASGLSALGLERWVTELFSHEGRRFTAWRSEGCYRETEYRLSEASIWQRRPNSDQHRVRHLMQIDVAVPRPFTGTVELVPCAGFVGQIDDVIRQLTGNAEQRVEIDPAFDSVFDTMVSQGTSTDDLLTSGFRHAILALAARYPRMHVTGRFENGWFSLRLPIPHLVFSSARLTKPMTDMAHEADALWWDLTVPHRLIDALMGDRDGPLR